MGLCCSIYVDFIWLNYDEFWIISYYMSDGSSEGWLNKSFINQVIQNDWYGLEMKFGQVATSNIHVMWLASTNAGWSWSTKGLSKPFAIPTLKRYPLWLGAASVQGEQDILRGEAAECVLVQAIYGTVDSPPSLLCSPEMSNLVRVHGRCFQTICTKDDILLCPGWNTQKLS